MAFVPILRVVDGLVIENPTEMDLKEIFNEKFYNYIKKKENRLFGCCNFE